MKIIKAQATDDEKLTELTIKSKAYWNYSLKQIDEWRPDLTISAQYIEKNQVYKLMELDTLKGYYSFFPLNRKEAILDNLFVDPQYIGKGYGKVLMNHFLEKVKNLGFEKVSLYSDPNAEIFYSNVGFKVVGKLKTSIKYRFLPIMELELNTEGYKPKLLILSDLWGFRACDWVKEYTDRLKSTFEIQQYDCCSLGEIDISDYKEDVLHQQFVTGGIEIAAKKLALAEKEQVDILAFSVGGVIAWKAGLLGLNIRNFYGVSATRLRYETEKSKGSIKLFFGEKDLFKPKKDWYKSLELDYEIVANKSHRMYQEEGFSATICEELLK